MLQQLLRRQGRSLEDVLTFEFGMDRVRFMNILSPKLRDIFVTAERLDTVLRKSRYLAEQGLDPTSSHIAEIVAMTDKLIEDVLYLVRRILEYKNQKDVLKDFEKNMGKFQNKIKEYHDKLFAMIGTEKEGIKKMKVLAYLEACSAFLYSYIYPILNDLKESLSLMSDIWIPMEEKFAKFAINRLGVFIEEEEEEKK